MSYFNLIKTALLSAYLLLICFSTYAQENCHKVQLPLSYRKNPNTRIFRLDSNVIGFVSEMTIDVDGSPQAYNPQDTGLDALASAGGAAHLSPDVIVFKKGKPYIQKSTDPFPGYYLSQTALTNNSLSDTNYRRYVNADSIPYVSLPFNMFKNAGIGDLAFVLNKKTNKSCFAIIADKGDNTHIGEGSVALANALNIKLIFKRTKHQIIAADAVNGTIAYIIFEHTGNAKPLTIQEIAARASLIQQSKIDKYLNCLLE